MIVLSALLLGLSLAGQVPDAQAAPPPPAPAASTTPASALVSHLSMEIDDLDYEVVRQRAAIGIARTKLAVTQRALQRGVASRGEVEQVTADVRALETREAEARAFQALKAYERDVLSHKTPVDE